MSNLAISNLATLLGSQSRSAAIRSALETAQTELSTGRRASLIDAAGGDLRSLYDVEMRLSTIRADLDAVSVGETRLASVEAALGQISLLTDTFGPEFADAASGLIPGAVEKSAARARDLLEDVIGVLNIAPGGRALFGGINVDGPIVSSAQDVLTAAAAAINGSTDLEGDLLAFFNDPAGPFQTVLSAAQSSPETAKTSLGGEVAVAPTTTEPALLQTLAGLTAAALSVQPPFATDPAVVSDLQSIAVSELLGSRGTLTQLREAVGTNQAELDNLRARLVSEETSLNLLLNKTVASDPFETATQLSALEAQLDAFYTVTARQTALSLTRYL